MAASLPKNWNDLAAVSSQATFGGSKCRTPSKKSGEKCQMRFGDGSLWASFALEESFGMRSQFLVWVGVGQQRASQCLLRNNEVPML